MLERLKSLTAAGISMCLLTAGILAHESWMLPSGAISAGGELTLGLTSGMSFPDDDHPIKPERVTQARWRQGDASGALKVGARGEKALALSVTLPKATSTTLFLQLPPNSLDLDAENVAEYLRDLGEPAGVRERYERQGKWRESYRKSIKALVATADAGERGDDARKPVGLPLELVPVSDPRTLHVGDLFELELIADGKALTDLRVGLHTRGVAARFADTDARGRVKFRLLHGGPTLFYATQLRAVESPDREWDSDFTTLTLEVPHASVQ